MINTNYSRLYRYTILFVTLWTAIIYLSLFFNITNERKHARDLAINEARINFNKDQAFRMWAASHGGVYVPPDETTPPNPYLRHIVDRDVLTDRGKQLTLMNPAFMLRQAMDFYSDLYGTKGRITSLNVLNPINAPDEWEVKALKAFERGEKEITEFIKTRGEQYLRFMRPMITKQACLKCHGHQGYKVNDVRGGVSISVPMRAYLSMEEETLKTLFLSHIFIWLTGLAAAVIVMFKGKDQITKNRIKDKEVNRLTSIIENTDDIVGVCDREGNILYANKAAKKLLGISGKEDMRDLHISGFYTEKVCNLVSVEAIPLAVRNGVWKGETDFIDSEGRKISTSQIILSHKGSDGKVEFLSSIAHDITDRKKVEAEIRYRLSMEENLLSLSKLFSSQDKPDFYKVLTFLDDTYDIDNSYLFLFHKESKKIYKSYSCSHGRREKGLEDHNIAQLPWFYERLESGENIVIYDIDTIPKQGSIEKELFKADNIRALLAVPIKVSKLLYGFTAITSESAGYHWTKEQIRIIRIVNEMMANYLARQESCNQILDSLHEKEVLLKEVHHRVKNNLQLISSLIYLQSEQVKEKRYTYLMAESRNRIMSMAMIHEKLYQSENLANINFKEYIWEIATHLIDFYSNASNRVALKLNVEECRPDIDRAIPCGLIINELISNSLKHAFPDSRDGEIYIELKHEHDGKYRLIVKDNGIGIPDSVDPDKTNSLGLKLVRTLARNQLKGVLDMDRRKGTEIKIIF